MKKITFMIALLTSVWGYSQTYSLYTEDATISAGSGVPIFFNNVNGFSDATSTSAYEGSNAKKFVFDNTSSWFMCQILHSNGTYGAQDFSAYGYYNVALKTTSTTSFYIRMKGNDVTAKILFSNGADPYGFARDGEWHFMSIPVGDFVPESGAFDLVSISELFVLRSDGTLDAVNNDFEFDHFFMSTDEVLSTSEFKNEVTKINIYPNPSNSEISINSTSKVDFILIYNIMGQKILESKISQNLNVSSLKKGIYLLKSISNGVTTTAKFIKE